MSFNVINVEREAPMFYGERILFQQKNVKVSFSGSHPAYVKGSYTGTVYVTASLIAFIRKARSQDVFTSFSALLRSVKAMDFDQPLFGCNNLKLTVVPEPGGGASSDVKLKMEFYDGGTYECYTILRQAINELTGVTAGATAVAANTVYSRTHMPKPPPYPHRNGGPAPSGNPPEYAANEYGSSSIVYDPNNPHSTSKEGLLQFFPDVYKSIRDPAKSVPDNYHAYVVEPPPNIDPNNQHPYNNYPSLPHRADAKFQNTDPNTQNHDPSVRFRGQGPPHHK